MFMTAQEPAKIKVIAREVLGYNLRVGQPIDDSVLFDLLEADRKHNYCGFLMTSINVYFNNDRCVKVYEDIKEEAA